MGFVDRSHCEWHLGRFVLSSHLVSAPSEEAYRRRAASVVLRGVAVSIAMVAPLGLIHLSVWHHWKPVPTPPNTPSDCKLLLAYFGFPVICYLAGTTAIAALLYARTRLKRTPGSRANVRLALSGWSNRRALRTICTALVEKPHDGSTASRSIIAASAFAVPLACLTGVPLFANAIENAIATWVVGRFGGPMEHLDKVITGMSISVGVVLLGGFWTCLCAGAPRFVCGGRWCEGVDQDVSCALAGGILAHEA